MKTKMKIWRDQDNFYAHKHTRHTS